MIRGRKKITWTAGAESHIKTLRPHPYVQAYDLPSDKLEALKAYLVPGALWLVENPLQYESSNNDFASHEFPYVKSGGYPWLANYQTGTVALYAGTVRVQEESRAHTLVRIERHSFIICGKRYITSALGDFRPIASLPE